MHIMANMFQKAKQETTQPKKDATKGKKQKEYVSIKGVQTVAEIDAAIKSLEALRKTAERRVEQSAKDIFFERGIEKGKNPGNFDAEENGATANIQFRKRSSNSQLSDEEVGKLDEYGISYDEVVKQEGCFKINPEYTNNQDLLERVGEALEGIDGIPEDFIQYQEEQTKKVVSKNAVDEVFAVDADEAQRRELLEIVTTFSTRKNMGQKSMKKALANILEMMEDEED